MTVAGPLQLLVRERETISDQVVRFELVDPSGASLPAWDPGAHIAIEIDGGLVRQYSLCSDPTNRGHWQIAVLREHAGRGGSRAMHDRVTSGATVGVRGPRNDFVLEPCEEYLFIAGGIGITPLIPMMAAAQASGSSWQLVYGGRTRSSMAFVDELTARYGDRVRVRPQDEVGLIDLDLELASIGPAGLVYCCGPEPLLRAVEMRCADAPHRLRVERFAVAPPTDDGAERAFEVELQRSGLHLRIPAHRSILEVAEDAGAPVLFSCREGVCGTCETVVLDGRPEHRDLVYSPEEHDAEGTMMICVSRAVSERLVLDL